MDTINLSVGGWSLGVRADTVETARAVRATLGNYESEGGPRLPSNFSVRAAKGFLRRKPGSLYIGGSLVASCRTLRPLLRALVSYLAGLPDVQPQFSRIEMRVFVRDGNAVLAHLERPLLVDDPALSDAGISEAYLWQPVVDPDLCSVVVPDPLPAVDWLAGGGDRVPSQLPTLAIVGVLARPGEDGTPDLRAVCAQALYNRDAWLNVLDRLCERELVRSADNAESARRAILSLLGCGPTHN